MSLNHREIDLVLDELSLAGTHIQQVWQPDYTSLVFELYRPREAFLLLVSLKAQTTRIHRISKKPKRSVKTPRFTEFLRSRIRGARIIEASQIFSERIVRLKVLRTGEETRLYIRLWPNAANVIATENDGTILDAFFRRPKRGEQSGGHYKPEEEFADIDEERSKKKKEFSVRECSEEKSFNEYLEEHYDKQEYQEKLENLKTRLEKLYAKRENKIYSVLNSIRKRKENYEQFDTFKEYGDIIMANLHQIPKGGREISLANFYRDNETARIPLDPELNATENAEQYYKKYRKAKSGLGVLEDEIKNQEQQLRTLKAEFEHLYHEADIAEIESYIDEQKAKTKGEEEVNKPGLKFSSGGFTILLGRNSRENDELLRQHSRGNDLWLHARDYPGSYVFIRSKPKKTVPLETLLDAANLAVYYSKGKNEGTADLYYTQVKYLRRVKNGKRGLVIPTQEKNLTISIDRERIIRLTEGQ